MLTEEEEKFLQKWAAIRERESGLARQMSLGLPIGILIGIGIVLNYISGWYSRATMVANSQSTPMVLIIAIIIIALFCSIFYKRHQWDMNEQRFISLTKKRELEVSGNLMQHEDTKNSQVSSDTQN